MALIDDKGKVFGIINFFDLLVIFFILFCVSGISYQLGIMKGFGQKVAFNETKENAADESNKKYAEETAALEKKFEQKGKDLEIWQEGFKAGYLQRKR